MAIKDAHLHIDKSEVPSVLEIYFDEQQIVSNGFEMVAAVKKLSATFSAMIMNTYFVCVLVTTCAIYSSSSIILLSKFTTGLLLYSTSMFLVACLYIGRLVWLTSVGQNLSNSMKKCGYHLDRFKPNDKKMDGRELELLRQDITYHSESPIAPFSFFSLSNSTLLGAFGTIITYLIVLLQFKTSELTSVDLMNPVDVQNATNIFQNDSNTLML